ncbi:AmmeMemoRadiSam system protein B [bacterium]|nr:AmmeMemoRadiSam system protein B [bacterium]
MAKIKEPSVAGSFYTNDIQALKTQIESFANESKNKYEYKTRAVIVPHAGLVYSGRLAFEGISQIDNNVENIFIFAPAHRVGFDGIALSSFDKWKTPLGEIDVNQNICKELIEKYNAKFNDNAVAPEHSIEIEIPIIQSLFNNVNIIPILIGKADFKIVFDIINEYYPNTKNGFIISSDLSHFLSDKAAQELDNKTAQMIETGNINGFTFEQACGALGIAGLVEFANKNNYSLIRIDMTNSSLTTNDKSSVVGYGCWFLYEGDKNEFIKRYYKDFVIDIAKLVLKTSFTNEKVKINYPQVFNEFGACFVTLEKSEQLRGCIGSIIAHQPLIADLLQHAKDAAFNDYRFNPVTENELKDIKVSISILTEPKKIDFNDEEDLLNKMVPNIDGIIIKDEQYQAVYLPVVWEQLPDKRDFLNSLKMKAGLSPTHFSKTFEAYRFESIYIKEN